MSGSFVLWISPVEISMCSVNIINVGHKIGISSERNIYLLFLWSKMYILPVKGVVSDSDGQHT